MHLFLCSLHLQVKGKSTGKICLRGKKSKLQENAKERNKMGKRRTSLEVFLYLIKSSYIFAWIQFKII